MPGCDAVKIEIIEAIENDNNTSIMNLSEIIHQHAITSPIRHQINLKLCAAANSRYFNQLNRARLGKDVFLTSFFKIAREPFAIDKIDF